MNIQTIRLSLASFSLLAALAFATSQAAQPAAISPPSNPVKYKYRLELVSFYDGNPREQMFAVVFLGGGVVCRTIDSLKKFIADMPPNSTITWAPSDAGFGGELLLSSPKEMEAFKAFCAEKRVELVIVPGG
jgi:hypothetical protein